MTDKTPRTEEAARVAYEAARHVGIPAEQLERFIGTLAACGYIVTAKAETAVRKCEELCGTFINPNGPHSKEYATACADLQDAIRAAFPEIFKEKK